MVYFIDVRSERIALNMLSKKGEKKRIKLNMRNGRSWRSRQKYIVRTHIV